VKKSPPVFAEPLPEGKARLIDAAVRLAARDGRAVSSLGLRELAREAGLNHNTFYRHFESIEELGRFAAERVALRLMTELKKIRSKVADPAEATIRTTEYFLDFVRDHPETIVVGLRELHSHDSAMRRILQHAMNDIAANRADQLAELNLFGGMDRDTLLQATRATTYYSFYRALDYIEHPRQRRRIRDDIVSFIHAQFLGRIALKNLGA